MMYRDEEHSGRPEAPHGAHAMVGPTHPPGDALLVQSNGAATALAVPAALPSMASHNVLRGGMDANTFLNSLRRRWILATGIGLVAAAGTAIALWVLFPESSSATALFEVSSERETLAFNYDRYNPNAFDILKKTQLAKLTSYYVLYKGLRQPGVASLSVFADEPYPVEWLQENIEVDFPQQGEILSISISAESPPEDLEVLVNAIAKAYEEEVIYDAKSRKLQTRDLLAKSLQSIEDEIEEKLKLYLSMAKEQGKTVGIERDPHTDLLLREIAESRSKMSALETQIFQMQTEYAIQRSRVEDQQFIDAQFEMALSEDVQWIALKEQLFMSQYMAMQSGSSSRRGRSADKQNRGLAQLEAAVEQYKAQAKQEYMREYERQPNLMLQQLQKEFQTLIVSLKNQHELIKRAFDQQMLALNERVETSVDLEQQNRELAQLQEVAKDMSIRLEGVDVEANAPPQIRQVQPAVPRKGINTAQHYSISILGGMAAFALTCLGIAYMEFRNRRLDGPEQVDEGLGIRVVGTLPSLTSRKALDASHPVVAQLTESIDGVRTILMHDSTSKRRQVVLVTSAATMEGRTTVASQLAASLARAGRRTLLIDGDLRRPALHALFDVPLEDGLCEVLRAEVDAADVIRPTHAEGLWLLTAGYCDIDAIHALATEQMQPVFDKLRAEYDFIIIDGAPVLGMSDALIFGQYSDGAVLSVRRDHSQMPKINQAAELLRGVGIRIIGAVVNGVPTKADDRITQMRLMAPKSERQLEPAAS
jgi:capsular exopolysaccharide synthesis family protein